MRKHRSYLFVIAALGITGLALNRADAPSQHAAGTAAALVGARLAADSLSPAPASAGPGTSTVAAGVNVALTSLRLPAGSAVYVPGPVVFRVRVFGAVDHPGDVELNSGDRLAVAIAKAGNSPSMNADLNHIHITHTLPNGQIRVTEVNLYLALKNGDLASDAVLTDDDVVYVPESAKKTDGVGGILGLARHLFLPF